VLIYFMPEAKLRTLQSLAFAVRAGGLLFLGRSEAIPPVPGFERVGLTTLFRRGPLQASVAKRKPPKQPPPRRAARSRRPMPRDAAARAAVTPDERFTAQQDLNDELQSRNEELETVNEELQSLNDEMSAMEEQMRGLGEESRRANDFLRLLLDTSPDVLIACDADDKVLFWSKAAIKRFRLSPQQAVGGKLFDLVPALDHPALRAASRKVRQAGRASRVELTHEGDECLFDSLPGVTGSRRSYLLRLRPAVD
jgi:PAS domain-containing protein